MFALLTEVWYSAFSALEDEHKCLSTDFRKHFWSSCSVALENLLKPCLLEETILFVF